MIGFCDVSDIRNSNVNFTPDAVTSNMIRERISSAEEIIISLLSSLYSTAELTAFTGAFVLKQLCIFKTMEITLVTLYGATREVDKVDDIVYWKSQFNSLLAKVLSGESKIEIGGQTEGPIAYPKLSKNPDGTSVQPIYTDRGLVGFNEE